MHNADTPLINVLAVILLLLFIPAGTKGQPETYPFDIPQYGFIRYDLNRFKGAEQNPSFERLYSKFDSLLIAGAGQISMVHIGGSHIQADIYTHRMRKHLQSFYPGINGARGFIFPYAIAETNNPSNYHFEYTGQWKSRTNSRSGPDLKLGLSGITVALQDTLAFLKVYSQYDTLHSYDFNRVRVFASHLSPGIINIKEPGLIEHVSVNDSLGYIRFDLREYLDTLELCINAGTLEKGTFELYGISLENDDPGVTYNTIGVNGATLASYLKCELFVPHLKALEPDLVIVSIGTNDAYTRGFDVEGFRTRYADLIGRIHEAAPDAALLLTIPNDSYLYRREINPNTQEMEGIISALAITCHAAVWDFYHIMGGYNASMIWLVMGLMNKDLVHFNVPGYMLKGDLFFNAFLNSWENHLQN